MSGIGRLTLHSNTSVSHYDGQLAAPAMKREDGPSESPLHGILRCHLLGMCCFSNFLIPVVLFNVHLRSSYVNQYTCPSSIRSTGVQVVHYIRLDYSNGKSSNSSLRSYSA